MVLLDFSALMMGRVRQTIIKSLKKSPRFFIQEATEIGHRVKSDSEPVRGVRFSRYSLARNARFKNTTNEPFQALKGGIRLGKHVT
jgi:hypothetical protein